MRSRGVTEEKSLPGPVLSTAVLLTLEYMGHAGKDLNWGRKGNESLVLSFERTRLGADSWRSHIRSTTLSM